MSESDGVVKEKNTIFSWKILFTILHQSSIQFPFLPPSHMMLLKSYNSLRMIQDDFPTTGK